MLLPSEFIESFEKQYPHPTLDYTLPESLSRCPKLQDKVNKTVVRTGALEFTYMDSAGATYDMLNRRYKTLHHNVWANMEKAGYDLIFDKVYKLYADNLSPRSFSFILEDLAEINHITFAAQLQIQMSKFTMEKSIALQQSWFKFCLEYPNSFNMDFDEYNEIITKLDTK